MKKYKNICGFTLIELLVVVAIISLLSSIVMSSIDESRKKAEWRAFDSEIIQIRTALQLYVTEKGEWPEEIFGVTVKSDIWINDMTSNMDILIEELKSAGFYENNIDNFRDPEGNEVGIRKSTKLDSYAMNHRSCGKPENDDVFMTFFVEDPDDHRSTILKKAYKRNGDTNDGYCIEIR